jgi:hypothetical protein
MKELYSIIRSRCGYNIFKPLGLDVIEAIGVVLLKKPKGTIEESLLWTGLKMNGSGFLMRLV